MFVALCEGQASSGGSESDGLSVSETEVRRMPVMQEGACRRGHATLTKGGAEAAK